MAESYNVKIVTTAEGDGADITQDALEKTAQAGEKIVDSVSKGDRATAQFVTKLKQLTPEQLAKVRAEMERLANAEEAAGRDASALRSQLQRVADVNLEKQVKNASGLFGSIAAGTLAANAITQVTSALTNHLQQSVELADQLDDLAGRAGVAASELQRIGNTASQNNGSIAGTADALSKVQISAQGAIEKDGPLREMFHRLGIEVKDLRSLSPSDLFYKIADAVQSSNDRGRTFTDVVGVMGRSSKDLFTTLELGGDTIRKTGDAIGVFSDDTIKKLAGAKDAIQSFQNELTIFAGNSIKFFADYKKFATDNLADSFSEAFGLGTLEIAKFNAVQDRATEAAGKAKSAVQGESDELDTLAAKAGEAANKLESINQAFTQRSLAKLPLAFQLDDLQLQLARVRDEASRALPDAVFKGAEGFFREAKAKFGNEIPDAVQKTIQRFLQLETAIDGIREAQKKAAEEGKKAAAAEVLIQGDLVKQLRSLTVESQKPNLSVVERIKLLEQELAVIEKIKASEQTRVKAANAANPQAAARVKELNDQLSNLPVTGRPQDAETRGNLQRERNELVKTTGVGVEGATTALDATIKQTNAALDRLKGSIDTEGGRIPPGLQGVQTALDGALKSFQEGLAKTSGSVDKGVPQVVDAVKTLEGAVSAGLDGIAAANAGAAAAVDRKFEAVRQQIDSLWRAV